MTCPNFPGQWTVPDPGCTARIYHICRCAECVSEYDCPTDVKTGSWIQVAGSHGVFPAKVVGMTVRLRREGERDPDAGKLNVVLEGRGFQLHIESDDPKAPDYLRRRVHGQWTICTQNSLWRAWIPCPSPKWGPPPPPPPPTIETRYDRDVL